MRLALFVILPAFFLGGVSYFLFLRPPLTDPLVLPQATAATNEVEISLPSQATPTLVPTNTPTLTPTPLLLTKPSLSPSPIVGVQQYLLSAVNSYRISVGLSPFSSDPHTCNFARMRAQEISSSFNHDGFRNRLQSNTLPYPGFKEVAENIAMNSDYKQVVSNWINSPGHAENMRKDTPYACVERFGDFYVYESWKP